MTEKSYTDDEVREAIELVIDGDRSAGIRSNIEILGWAAQRYLEMKERGYVKIEVNGIPQEEPKS